MSDLSRDELAALRELAASNPTSGRGQAARLGAIRALERHARVMKSSPRRQRYVGLSWEHPDLDDEGRAWWFKLDVRCEISRVLHGHIIDQPEMRDGSARVDEIRRVAERVEAAEDGPAEFRKWLAEVDAAEPLIRTRDP